MQEMRHGKDGMSKGSGIENGIYQKIYRTGSIIME